MGTSYLADSTGIWTKSITDCERSIKKFSWCIVLDNGKIGFERRKARSSL